MRKACAIECLVLTIIIISSACAEEIVNVGGYLFPPFVEETENDYSGITIDLIDLMNDFQSKYSFDFVPISAIGRHHQFNKKLYDMIIFENTSWGWKGMNIDASKVLLKGGEVYITRAEPDKNQSFFKDIKSKSIAVILGYHYGFAGFNSDEKYLRENFNIQISSHHRGNIVKVLHGKTDIAVVTNSFLKKFIKENPSAKKQLLVSNKMDQEYNHTILLRKDFKMTIDELNSMITKMEDRGVFNRLWQDYGLK